MPSLQLPPQAPSDRSWPLFQSAVDFTLRWEGGYVNDPHDPGGETNLGISKRSYPSLDIASLTRDDAVAIYYRDFWVPAGCSHMPAPLAAAVFDTSVLCGLDWTATVAKSAKTARDVLVARLSRHAQNPNVARYGAGWFRRVLALHALTLTLEEGE